MMILKTHRYQTIAEEIGNASTHGLGIVLSIAALVILTSYASVQGDPWKIVSSAIFGVTLILLYTASTLYHSFRQPDIKRLLKTLDHSMIYLLIAGSYTPFTLVTMRGVWGWTLFGMIWAFAAMGVLFKLFFTHRFTRLSTFIYLVMGWLVMVAIKPLYHSLPMGGLGWLFLGGFFYTAGVVFYSWKRLHFSHTLWHLFVLAGSICHFFGILFYVVLGSSY